MKGKNNRMGQQGKEMAFVLFIRKTEHGYKYFDSKIFLVAGVTNHYGSPRT